MWSGDVRLDPLAFELGSQGRQPALEAHLRRRLGRAGQARDLGEGAALNQLQADDPPLFVRELRDRLVDRVRNVAAVFACGQFVVDLIGVR